MFYSFRQNNSGGSFHGPEEIIVEAVNAATANDLASRFGIYFDGCDNGRDCSCCGDRWYETSDRDGTTVPSHYGTPLVGTAEDVVRANPEAFSFLWSPMTIDVHYLDGRKESWAFDNKLGELAKEIKRQATVKLWGFRIFNSGPEKVQEFWQTDYDKDSYYDKTGNNNIMGTGLRSHAKFGFQVASFGADTEEEAEEMHTKLVDLLPLVKQIAEDAASIAIHQSKLPKGIQNKLVGLYKYR